ncbi:MAG TPA: hypothetical protein VGC34_00845, partial [Steroidobacteraceae bacterium]
MLTFDGSGLYSDGGTTTIAAANIAFANSQATPNSTGANTGGAGGSLIVDTTGTVSFGAGVKTFFGFGETSFIAGQQILFTGSGSLDAKSANVILAAPALIANGGSTQALTTTGGLTIEQGAGTAPALVPANIGGSLTLTAAGIIDSGAIVAQAGTVVLDATSGDVIVDSTASIRATGSEISLFDTVEEAPGGFVRLISAGNVSIADGATIDVSGTGNGFAGSLGIQAAGTATLGGTLRGSAFYADMGGQFALTAGNLAGNLPFDGAFTSSFAVSLQQGDISIATGQTLTSSNVLLVTNSGSIMVDGTIDASGPSAGTIQLFGAGTDDTSGVTINSGAQLLARYQAGSPNDPVSGGGAKSQNGGTIVLGTAGTPDGTVNPNYGYENVDASGRITVAAGAILDASGGAEGSGGLVQLRAPILTDNSANVVFNGAVRGAGTVALNAYATWSTTDSSTGVKHFDGIIDPAGWFGNDGTALAGTDQNGFPVNAPTPQNPLGTGQVFTPNTPNADHTGFYQNTLVNFVESFAPSNAGSLGGIELR